MIDILCVLIVGFAVGLLIGAIIKAGMTIVAEWRSRAKR